ncbi:MAG TPA: helix-turn-helix domain-containing protein [Verrucomicrobiae bacterium]|nr:helix-turn-helix domain-containing protein [Verrucomicrobiae bacterium]
MLITNILPDKREYVKLSDILDIKNDILSNLAELGFGESEAVVYYELTRRGPLTHLQLSRVTGISRTRVYRIIEQLQTKGVVAKKADDDGTAVLANGHQSLELALVNEAERLEAQQKAFKRVHVLLKELANEGRPPLNFSIRTYDGVAGFKQMLWNELKTKDELLAFGDGILEDLIGSRAWAEKQREMTVQKGYRIREIANNPVVPTQNQPFKSRIATRRVSEAILPLRHQIIIYNDTVSTYCWRDGQKTGIEVINQPYAQMMRAMFERYWGLAEPVSAANRLAHSSG